MIATFSAKGVVGVAQNHKYLELAYKGTLGQVLHLLHPHPSGSDPKHDFGRTGR